LLLANKSLPTSLLQTRGHTLAFLLAQFDLSMNYRGTQARHQSEPILTLCGHPLLNGLL
jgi:hypothetical protein